MINCMSLFYVCGVQDTLLTQNLNKEFILNKLHFCYWPQRFVCNGISSSCSLSISDETIVCGTESFMSINAVCSLSLVPSWHVTACKVNRVVTLPTMPWGVAETQLFGSSLMITHCSIFFSVFFSLFCNISILSFPYQPSLSNSCYKEL